MKKNEKKSSGLVAENRSRNGPRRSLCKCSKGLSTVEYVILLVLIAILGISAWTTFGKKLKVEIGKAEAEMPTI